MAKYNDFIGTLTNGSYGDGVTTPVPGFTRRYAVGSVVTYTVNADPLSPSGKSLKIKHNATNNRTGLTVDALNSDAGRTNLELIALVRNNWSAVATTNYGGLSAGMSGTTTSNNVGIFLAAGRDGASGMSVRVGYYPTLNPNQNLVGALPHYTLGTPFWLRLVLNGLNYQLYAYTESDLRGTPVATYSGVRPSDNADNWAGLFSFIANTDLDVLYLSAGTGGDAAPSPYDVAAPISFSGSIANQTFIEGQAVDVNFASLFAGSSTPFAFANAGASIAALGLSINSAGRLVGTAVQGQVTGVIVRGTDASAATANSNAFSVTVQSLLPQGVVTINSVTPTHNAAAITFSYNAADQTGYEYRINGGASVSAGSASPLNLNGFSASTPYSIEIRAVNANGNGNWSAPFNFSTTAAPLYPPDGIVTIAGVTPAQNTASVAFSYNDTDQTGFQYRLNGGAAASAGTSSPYILTGLSASTVYDVELRAINADGNGPWSSPVQFTTAAAIPPLTLDSVFDLSNVSSVNSTIANAASASPLVYMTPRAVSISVAINWRQFAAKFTNAAGKRPIFRHNRNNLDTPGTDPLSTWTPCWTTDFVTFHHAPSWSSPADKSYFEWQFTMPFDANADTVYILSSPMYPQWQSDTFTQEILATYGTVVTPTAVAVSAKTANPAWPTGAIFVTNALNDYPTESGEAMSNVNLGSLPIYGLKFDWGTTLGATTDGGPKRKAVLMYGQHAQGEAQASISFYGALRWLLSSADAAAVALRRNFVFYVYYNINGSGIKGGHRRLSYGTGAANTNMAQDLNRIWTQASPICPEIASTKAAITGDTSSAVDVFLDWHGTGFTRGMYNIVGSNTYLPANLTRWNTLAAAHFDMTLADMQSAAPSGYMMDYAYTTLGAKFSCGVEHSQRGTNTKEYRETTGINWLKTLRSADADKMFYSAPEVVAPAGTVTIGTVTVTTTTASVPYSYSGADATGFEYRVNGGAVVSASSSPQSLSSLTPNTAYQIEIRAVNSAGSGAWSSPSAFETEALVVPAVVINVVGIPNGSYKTSLFNHATGELLTRSDMTYVNGRSVYETGLPLGVKISGYVIDNLDPATNGSVIYCEVTNAAE